MASNFSAVPGRAVGPKSVLVSGTGVGRATPVSTTWIIETEVSWVMDSWLRLELGVNSETVPVTRTRLPTAAEVGGAVDVKTKMPSDVAGLRSVAASGVCRKKPLLNFCAVTTPSVVTMLPMSGEVRPAPWICEIGTMVKSSFSIVPTPTPSATTAPTTLNTVTMKVSSASGRVSPTTGTTKLTLVSPSGITPAQVCSMKSYSGSLPSPKGVAVPAVAVASQLTPPGPAGALSCRISAAEKLVPGPSPSGAEASERVITGSPLPPPTVTETSSMARPSSAPLASASFQRRQNVLPLAMDRLPIVADSAVRLPAALPSFAPVVAVLGVMKSSAFTSTHVPVVSEVASRLYWKSIWSVRAAVPRRHCSPV